MFPQPQPLSDEVQKADTIQNRVTQADIHFPQCILNLLTGIITETHMHLILEMTKNKHIIILLAQDKKLRCMHKDEKCRVEWGLQAK